MTKVSAKPDILTFPNKVLDRIVVDIEGDDVKGMPVNDFIAEIGGEAGAYVATIAVLTALVIASLNDGEKRVIQDIAAMYVWYVNMTPATALLFSETLEPDDKSPTVNGFWVRLGSLKDTSVVLTPGATVNLSWVPDRYWTLNNNQGGGITFNVLNLLQQKSPSKVIITTNGNPLTVAGFDVVDGKYATAKTTMVFEFYMLGSLKIGGFVPKVAS